MPKKGHRRSHRAQKNLRRRHRSEKRKSRQKDARKTPLKDQQHVGAESAGFDYGIRPRIAIAGDMSFIRLFGEAKCIAISYAVLPQHGVLSDVPAIGLAFENMRQAQELFRLIGSWVQPPSDSLAVDIRFVEDTTGGQYFFYMGQSFCALTNRMIGPGGEKDYEPLVLGGMVAKNFPLSHWLGDFKSTASGRATLIYPIQLRRNAKPQQGAHPLGELGIPRFDLGFMKDGIRYLRKSDLESSDKDYALAHFLDGKQVRPSDATLPKPPTIEAVYALRNRQMKRFFVVALARLRFNASYAVAKQAFRGRYADWQLDQAACNLLAKANWPEHSAGAEPGMIGIYDKLRSSVPAASDDGALHFPLKADGLERQIGADIAYLHAAVFPDSERDPEEELRSKGYL